jgi:alpha-tubulin suppressor-like RCC1 family protein
MFAWGNNGSGQLGLNSTAGSFSRATVNTQLSGIQRIAAGTYHVVAISRFAPGYAWAWGYNGYGQLGSTAAGIIQRSPYPMDAGPDTMNQITDVAAGGYFSLMIRGSDRAVFAVGDNASGQLGIGNRPQQNVPVLTSF